MEQWFRIFSPKSFSLPAIWLEKDYKANLLDLYKLILISIVLIKAVFTNSNNELLKDTHREKAPLNKTPVLTKGINMDIWAVITSIQLFIRGS